MSADGSACHAENLYIPWLANDHGNIFASKAKCDHAWEIKVSDPNGNEQSSENIPKKFNIQ